MRTESIGIAKIPIDPPKQKKTLPVQDIVEGFQASLDRVNDMQQQADQAIESLVTGEVKDIAQTMIAVEKANLSFELMTQIRNRIVEAYQEVMRMQV